MKVKLKDKIIDSDNEPIMVILTEQERVGVIDTIKENDGFACFPDDTPLEDMLDFMKV